MLLYPSRSLAFSSLSALLSFRSWQFPRGFLALTTTCQPFSSAASAASAGRSPGTRFTGFASRATGQAPPSLPVVAEYDRAALSDGRGVEKRALRRADDGGHLISRPGLSEGKGLGVTTTANGVLNGVSQDDFHESINGATNEAPSDADTFRAASVDINRETRPMRFDEVIGQDNTVTLLKAAVAGNQVVSTYLFYGPYGTGKTSAARILASAVNCSARKPGDGNPCGVKCPHCRAVADGTSEVVVEIDAASNRGVTDARKIVDDVKKTAEGEAPPTTPLPTTRGTRMVYILDECHMLTRDAWATLLDTLGEPVGDPVFILVTTDPEQLPRTIVSRCQELAFSPVPKDVMVNDLRRIAQMKRWEVSDDGLRAIAEEAAGSMRDAKKVLQQLSLLKKRITGDLVLDHFKRLPQWKAEAMLVHALSDAQPTEVAEAAKVLEGKGVAFPQVLRQLRDAATDALIRERTNRELDFITASPEGRSLLQAVVKELREAEKQQKEEPTNIKLFTSYLVQLPLLLKTYPFSFQISAAADSDSSSSPSPPSHPPSSLIAPAQTPLSPPSQPWLQSPAAYMSTGERFTPHPDASHESSSLPPSRAPRSIREPASLASPNSLAPSSPAPSASPSSPTPLRPSSSSLSPAASSSTAPSRSSSLSSSSRPSSSTPTSSSPPTSSFPPLAAPSGAARAEGEWGELARKAMAEMTPHQRSLFTQQACIVAVTDSTATDTTVTLSFLQAWIKKLNDGRRKTIIPGFTEAFSKALRSRVTIQLVDKESLGAATDVPSAEDLAAAASASAAAAAAAAAAKSGTVSKGAGRKVPEERRRAREGVSQSVPEEEGRGLVVASSQRDKGKGARKNNQASEAVPDHSFQPPPPPPAVQSYPQLAQLQAVAAKAAAARRSANMQKNQRRAAQQAPRVASLPPPAVVTPGGAGAHASYDRSDHVTTEAGSGLLESSGPEVEQGRGAADGLDSNDVSIHGPSQVNAVSSSLIANAGSSAASSSSSSSGGVNDITTEAVRHATELFSPELLVSGITEADQPETPAPNEKTETAILDGGEPDHGMTVGDLSHDYQASLTAVQPEPISVSEVKEEADGAFVGTHGGDAVLEGPAGGALVNGVVNGHVMVDTVHDGVLEASVGHGIVHGGALGDVAHGEELITDVERASDAVPVVAPASLVDGAASASADGAAVALADGAAGALADGAAVALADGAAVALTDGTAAALADGAAEAGADVEPVGAADVEPVGAADVEAVGAAESDVEVMGAAESDVEVMGAAESDVEAVGAAESDVEAVGAAESDFEAVGAAAAYVEDAAVVPASTTGADMEAAETGANAGGSSISAQAIPRVAAAEVDTGMDAAYPVDGLVGSRAYPDSGRREEGGALAASRMSPSRGTRPTVATASAGRGTSNSNVGGSTGGAMRMTFAPRNRTRGPFQPKALPSDHGAPSRNDPGAESGRPVNDVKTGGRFDDMNPAEAAAIALCKAFGGRIFVLREDNDREVGK
ncbi:unnamed protein product [Closterium sp. NIES-54]